LNKISNEKKDEMIAKIIPRLPQIRKEMKISQTDLGKKVGLSRQTISGIERGTAPLTWNNYLAIMMFLDSNRDRCKTIFSDDSEDLDDILAVINNEI